MWRTGKGKKGIASVPNQATSGEILKNRTLALNSPFPIPSSDARWLAVESTVRRRSRWNGAIARAKIDDHSRVDDPQATNATDEMRLLRVVWPVGPNNLIERYRERHGNQ